MSRGFMVRHGQLWADRDTREVRAGHRQRLRVIGIHNETRLVHLNNEETGVESWVLRDRLVRRFRLVQEPDLGLLELGEQRRTRKGERR